MKKFAVFCLILCIAGSAFCFTACGNDSDLSSELNRLRTEIANIRDDAKETADALTTRVASLETQLAAANEEITSLRTEVTRLTELSTTMSQTITELTNIVEDETSGNEALKAKLDTLQTQYEQTKATVNSLSSKVSALETNVSDLQTDLDTANTRLDAIESAVYLEPPVLNMGEEFVLKSPTGIEMLKVRLTGYTSIGGTAYGLDFNIERLNVPNSVNIDSYFNVSLYRKSNNEYYYKTSTLSEECGEDFSTRYNLIFSDATIPPEEVTYFMVGLPSDNDLSDNVEKQYIIPYAIYVL